MLTTQEIRQLGPKEMTDELQRTRRNLLRSQFDIRNGSSKEAHTLKNLRRYVAQLQTIAKEMKMDMQPTMSKAQAAAPEEKKTSESPANKKAAAPKKATAPKAEKAPVKKAATPAPKPAKSKTA